MCGILVSARAISGVHGEEETFEKRRIELEEMNSARVALPSGPDAQSNHAVDLSFSFDSSTPCSNNSDIPNEGDAQSKLRIAFYASELRLRGTSSIVQPHLKNGNVLCWNGEIFEGLEISSEENDGSKIFDKLCCLETPEQIRDLFSRIEGPYAFVFYHASTQRLYFARDPLGRRSLLLHRPTNDLPYFLLSSVSTGNNSDHQFEELSTEHIYIIDLKLLTGVYHDIFNGFSQCLILIPRTPTIENDLCLFARPGKVNTTIPPEDLPCITYLDQIPEYLCQAVDDLIYHLDRSVLLRVRDIPHSPQTKGKARIAVLFSGGIDSSVLTFIAHRHIPLEEPIDLLNVAFENPRKIKLQKEGNIGGLSKRNKREKMLSKNEDSHEAEHMYTVPDRTTGLLEVEELRRICPGRIWNFVEINVPYQECQSLRPVVESLMAPGRTVMDLSLALALYFASRGQGQVRSSVGSSSEPYHSQARVVLSGLGSDELLGGYGRHRTVYGSGGWKAVIDELQQEIDRIPTRNLGRDDRIISAHGKETRHPFLSLTLVSFLAALPVHFKLDPRLEPGLGDKMLLRLVARKLGLVEASNRKKRAMQFGSHSARMDGERRGDAELG
ncbi:hypothetical protein BYT27DRAFT_7233106 [Phlegmacium glaucopus]|nr:hypothetical protein BYT27DRAFT_7233106 [Phlegmacium glaucopus]